MKTVFVSKVFSYFCRLFWGGAPTSGCAARNVYDIFLRYKNSSLGASQKAIALWIAKT
ncbi:MAG: hypothetical protein LBB79_07940 [Prevotellaceae bacterium]|nr:hypothetical protein [Prevotellaceae bacterium]